MLFRTGQEAQYISWWMDQESLRQDEKVIIRDLTLFVSRDVFSPSGSTTNSVDVLLRHFPNVAGKRVLDIGTGCGVLAIKAALSQARQVIATEVSSAALENAKFNLAKTKTEGIVSLVELERFEELPGKFDVIIMNIIFAEKPRYSESASNVASRSLELHRRLITALPDMLKPNGLVLLGFASFGDIESLDQILTDNALDIASAIESSFGVNWYAIKLRRARQSNARGKIKPKTGGAPAKRPS